MVQSILSAIDAVGVATGLGAQQFRFVTCLLSCYPLGYIHRMLPTTPGNEVKHLFATIAGLVQAYVCFEGDVVHFIGATLATWMLMLLFPKYCGWLGFAYNMIHLTWGYVFITHCFCRGHHRRPPGREESANGRRNFPGPVFGHVFPSHLVFSSQFSLILIQDIVTSTSPSETTNFCRLLWPTETTIDW